jgi:hypothetical protein
MDTALLKLNRFLTALSTRRDRMTPSNYFDIFIDLHVLVIVSYELEAVFEGEVLILLGFQTVWLATRFRDLDGRRRFGSCKSTARF